MELDTLTTDNLVGVYRNIRDRKEAIEAQHKEQLEPYKENLKKIEGLLLKRMQDGSVTSVPTLQGTAYQRTVSSVKVANSGAFFDWLQSSGRWELADIRAAKKEVEAFVEKEQALPPGLDINRAIMCGVKKPTGIK
jgi:hypothetical protein